MLVADASSLVDFLIRRRAVGDWVADRVGEAVLLHCPHLVDVEVVSALRRLVSHAGLPTAVADEALERFPQLRIQRYPVTLLLQRLWSLRSTLSAYDACYVALSEGLGLPLLTTDTRLARSRGHTAQIIAPPARL